MGITERTGALGVKADLGGSYLKPGLNFRDTALLFQLIKSRSGMTWDVLGPALPIDRNNLSHYSNGDRRLPADMAEKIIEKVIELQIQAKKSWLTPEEIREFTAAARGGKYEKARLESEAKFRTDLQSKIIKAFEKKSRHFRFNSPLPAIVLNAIEDSIDRIQEAMYLAVERAEYEPEEPDLDARSLEERESDAEAALAATLAEFEREAERKNIARQQYEEILPRRLRQVRSK